jgi:hypothetical protein
LVDAAYVMCMEELGKNVGKRRLRSIR